MFNSGHEVPEFRFHILGSASEMIPEVNTSGFRFSSEALVGVFDILGFRRMIRYNDACDLGKKAAWISDIIRQCGVSRALFTYNDAESTAIPEVIQISDTFVFYLLNRTPQNLIRFCWNIHHALFYGILYGFPLRGAIATGELLIDTERNLLLGESLIEAYDLEKQQDWSGACVALSLQRYIETCEKLDETLFPLLVRYDIPWKDGTCREKVKDIKFAINWIADVANFIADDHVYTKFPPFEPGSPEESKIKNTEAFLKFVIEQKINYGPFKSPANRKIVLEDVGFPEGKIIRFVMDDGS